MDVDIKLSDIWQNNSWKFEAHSIEIPQDLKHQINSSFFPSARIQKDTPLLSLKGNGQFFYSSAD